MKTIVLASQKGGAGKTTLAAHLAVAAEEAGEGPVAMIDTDPQGTLRTWWEKRQTPSPALADIPLKTLAKQIGDLRVRGVKLAIIDTPPAITASIQMVI